MSDPAHLRLEPLEGLVDLAMRVAIERESIRVSASLRNGWGEAIYVFREVPPLVRIGDGRVQLTSTMPVIPPYVMPLRPHVPKVERVDHDGTLEIEASYPLPLRNKHPYPPPDARVGAPLVDEVATALSLTVGFFPVSDGNALVEGVPSYYHLRRQFLIDTTVRDLAIPVRRQR